MRSSFHARGVRRGLLFLLMVMTLASATASRPAAQVATGPRANTAFAAAWERGAPITVTGELTIIYADDFQQQRSELVHLIRDERTGASFQLRFEGQPPQQVRSGQRVRIDGRSVASQIYVAACCDAATATSSGIQTLTEPTAAVTGDQRTLVMIANFSDSAVSCTANAINDAMFADPTGQSVDGLYRASSLGEVSFSGRVVGPFALPSSSSESCDISGWADAADAMAAASGVDVGSYQHKAYVLPANNCPAAGMGTVGGNPSRAWIFMCGTKGVFAHEIGHNLGMDHASTPTQEYGDGTDPMAISTWRLPGLNAPHRHELGWLGASAVSLVNQSGLYDVAPLAADPAVASAPQAIMIAKPDTGEYYYLSYRTPLGFDNNIDGSYYYRLSIHRYKGDGSSTRTFVLAGLADGESFVDSVNGITVTQVGHDSNHATAQIQFSSTCTRRAPSMSLSPPTQSGSPGTTLTYALSVTNADSPACGPSTFALTHTLPAGWTGAVSVPALTIGPAASGQANVTVTSAGVAPAGTYAASVNISDATTAQHAASAAASYVVQRPLDTAPPSQPLNLKATSSQRLKQIQLSWTTASDNVGVAGYEILRNEALVGTSTTAGWIDREYSAGASYSYAVRAYDAAGNRSLPSKSVTVTLSSGGRKP